MESQLLINKFVQNVLGCTCPDKVFEQIEVNHILPSISPHSRSISIGERLLIDTWKVEDRLKELQENLLAMLEAGKKRDANGMSRFRLFWPLKTIKLEPPKQIFIFPGFKERMIACISM
jgi:hypothetical protein